MLEFRTDATNPKMTRTPEGWLRGDAVVSRTGVFEYVNPDGTMRYELRHPDDVLSEASLETLKQIPVTLEHPPKMLDSTNTKQYAVGQTGDTVNTDNGKLIVGFTVSDERAIQAIEQKLAQQLSLGYRLDLIPEQGVYQGEAYTHRQTNIRYNHLALVSQARAGASASINMDGYITFTPNQEEATALTTPVTTPRLDIVRLDGIEYQASPEVAKALAKAETANQDAKGDIEAIKKQLDEAKGKYDALKAELDEMKKEEGNKDARMAEAVTARLALINQASKLTSNTDGMEAMPSRDIMVKAIQAKATDFNADGKSDEYVQGRFDTMLEVQAKAVPDSVASQLAGGVPTPKVNADNFDSYMARAEGNQA